ncbi:MAG: DUF4264 family protein [Syntrophothermus sp.]
MSEPRIEVLGTESFAVSGDAHLLVTFLNKILKDKNLIFGMTRSGEDGRITLTIYEVIE